MSAETGITNNWAPWSFDEKRRLARYVCEDAEETFPLVEAVSWRTGNKIERDRAVRGIYERLAKLQGEEAIYYALNAYNSGAEQQVIRSPREIAATRHGTCLDLALLFAGLCMSERLCPIIVLTRGHAFALVSRLRGLETQLVADELPLAQGIIEDAALLRRLVDSCKYVAVECTGFASQLAPDGTTIRGPLSFEEALAAGRKALDGELCFALDVATARYRLGEPGQPDLQGVPLWRSLSRRWSNWEEAQLARIRFQEDVHPTVVESPATAWLREFLLSSPWHQQVEEMILHICKINVDGKEIRQFQKRLSEVDLSASYLEILDRLKVEVQASQKGPNQNGLKAIQVRIAEVERRTGLAHRLIPDSRLGDPAVRELRALRQLRQALFDLKDEVEEPRFERCLLVVGDLGAGKTHLTTVFDSEIAAPDMPWPVLLLRLEADEQGNSFREEILSALRRITGYEWPSLEAFQSYLDQEGIRRRSADPKTQFEVPFLVVILDDYERWLRGRSAAQKQLQNLIFDTTSLHSFYWVFLAQHAAFADVVPGNADWSNLAWLPEQTNGAEVPTISSWIDLSAIDQSQRLGIELIRQVSEDEGSPLRPEIEAGTPAERDLANPLVGWTVLECRAELPVETLASLNFIDFAKLFWERRRKAIDTAPLQSESLGRFVKYAVKVMVNKLGFQPPRDDLAYEVSQLAAVPPRSELSDSVKTQHALGLLEEAGFWNHVTLDDIPYLQLRNQFFWSYRIAQSLFEDLAKQEKWEFDKILPEADLYLREGVIEFLLLLADGRAAAEGSGGARVAVLWRQALEKAATAVWLGAVKASEETQRVVAEEAQSWHPQQLDHQALFAFLYFLGESLPEALCAPRRIAALKTLYPAIAKAGLADYFLHVLEKTFRNVEGSEELLAAVELLAGVEVLGITEQVGDLIADTVAWIFENDRDKILAWLLDYARQESARLRGGKDAMPSAGAFVDGKFFLRQWIFFSVLDQILDTDRRFCAAHLFEKLEKISWYDPDALAVERQRVGRDMEVQADSVLGYWYHREPVDQRKLYEELIEHLVQGQTARDKRLAFFLIRHTVPAGGKKGIRFDPEFRSLLQRLFLDQDPEIRSLVVKFYDDFRVNLGADFPELEKEREAAH